MDPGVDLDRPAEVRDGLVRAAGDQGLVAPVDEAAAAPRQAGDARGHRIRKGRLGGPWPGGGPGGRPRGRLAAEVRREVGHRSGGGQGRRGLGVATQAAQGLGEAVAGAAGRRLEVDDGAEVLHRLRGVAGVASGEGGAAEGRVRRGGVGRIVGERRQGVAGPLHLAQREPRLAQVQAGRRVARESLHGGGVGLGGGGEVARLLRREAELVAPGEVFGLESPGVLVAGSGGGEQPVGLVQLTEPAVGGGQVPRLPPAAAEKRRESGARRADLFADGRLGGGEVGMGDRREVGRPPRTPVAGDDESQKEETEARRPGG